MSYNKQTKKNSPNRAKEVKLKLPNSLNLNVFLTFLTGKASIDEALKCKEEFARNLCRLLGISASRLDSLPYTEPGACAHDYDANDNYPFTQLEAPQIVCEDPKHLTDNDKTVTKTKELTDFSVEGVDDTKIPPRFPTQNAEHAPKVKETKEEDHITETVVESDGVDEEIQIDEDTKPEFAKAKTIDHEVQTELAVSTRDCGVQTGDECGVQTEKVEPQIELKSDTEENNLPETSNNRTTTAPSRPLDDDDIYCSPASSENSHGGARRKDTFVNILQTNTNEARSLLEIPKREEANHEEKTQIGAKIVHKVTAQRKLDREIPSAAATSATSKLQSGNFNFEDSESSKSNHKQRSSEQDDEFLYELEERAQSVPEGATYHDIPERKYKSMGAMYSSNIIRRPLQSINRPYYLGMDEYKEIPSKRYHPSNTARYESLPFQGTSPKSYSEPTTRKSFTDSDISASHESKLKFSGQSSPVTVQSPPEGAELSHQPNHRHTPISLGCTISQLEALDEEQILSETTSASGSSDSLLPSASNRIESSQTQLNISNSTPSLLTTDNNCTNTRTPEHLEQREISNELNLISRDCTPPSSRPNLTPDDQPMEIQLPASVPQPNPSNINDLETDCSLVNNTSDNVAEVVLDDSENNESCDITPQPIENVTEQEDQGGENEEHNNPTENIERNENSTQLEASHQNDLERSRTAVRSGPVSAQNRRMLRAQRRSRQRQNRNRSTSSQAPEGAGAASNDSIKAKDASKELNTHEMLQRFGIDPDETEEDVDIEEVRKENQRLKNAKLCQVCRDKDANRLFLPCAHLSSCSLCSPALTKCPQCRSNIRGIVSVYFG